MERFFQISQSGSTISKELTAGLTTFLTMSYIIFVNPSILSQTGMSYSSVFVATCVAAAIGTLMMGLVARLPFAQAPGMGLIAFFTFTVVFGLGYSWQEALAVVFLSGVLFLILTITGIRGYIIKAIPSFIKFSIAPGIGLFIALIGLNNAQIIDINQGPIINVINDMETMDKASLINAVNDAGPQVLQLGSLANSSVLLALIGFLILAALMVRRIPAAMIWSVVLTTIIGVPLGVTQIPDTYDIGEITLSDTLFQLDISSLFSAEHSIVSVVVVIISFTMVDLLDTLGTLIGTANKGGLLDNDGNLPQMDRALLADATATTCGALLGTSSVTTYIESGAGVVAGGRTGLTAVTTGVLFLMAIFLAPIAGVVPVAATSPILVMVGILMMDGLKKIDLHDMQIAIPAIAMIVMMPFTYSIANGIAIGLILHVFISVVMGQWEKVNPVLILLVLLFSLQYVLI